jgi:hypothetical protein
MICPPLPIIRVCRSQGLRLVVLAAVLLLIAGAASAADLCVLLARDGKADRAIPAVSGSEFRLRFRHSIYGSQVEEAFELRPTGFRLVGLRYEEARLVEFYGHERAIPDRGAWSVRPAPRLFAALNLQASPAAVMSIHVDAGQPVEVAVESTIVVRLMAAPCQIGNG